MLNSARVVAMLIMVRFEVDDAIIVRSSVDLTSSNQVSDVVSVPAAAGCCELAGGADFEFFSL